MNIERDLVASGVAAVARDLDVALLAHSGESAGCLLVPELDLHNVGFEVVKNHVSINDGLQLFKQGVALFGVVGADFALLLVAVDRHGRVTENVLLFLDIGTQLGGILLQIFAKAYILGGALTVVCKMGIQIVRHVFAFDLHSQFLLYVICI